MAKHAKLVREVTAGTAAKRRNAARGQKAIAIVLRMKDRIERSFYTMGRELKVLKQPAVFRALGHPSFAQLCAARLKISVGQADRLVHIVESFGERDTKHLTSTKATAVIKLASALGGETTAKGLLAHGTVHLPGGHVIDVRSADANAIDAAARQVAASHPKHFHGGLAVSKAARAFFARLRREVAAVKATSVRVEALAASKATGGSVRIVVSVPDAAKLGHALIRAAQP